MTRPADRSRLDMYKRIAERVFNEHFAWARAAFSLRRRARWMRTASASLDHVGIAIAGDIFPTCTPVEESRVSW